MMKSKELGLLKQQAELIIDGDPELKSLRKKFIKFGCTKPESLGAVLGRAFSELAGSSDENDTINRHSIKGSVLLQVLTRIKPASSEE